MDSKTLQASPICPKCNRLVEQSFYCGINCGTTQCIKCLINFYTDKQTGRSIEGHNPSCILSNISAPCDTNGDCDGYCIDDNDGHCDNVGDCDGDGDCD